MTDWRPTASPETLRLRARVLGAVRRFFEERGSLEVETPCIVASPGVDVWLDAPAVDLDGVRAFLATSPEYAMKRLLAAGSGPIHQIGPAFRAGEVGRLHEPQFTMVEWYEPGADDGACMDTTEALVRTVAAVGDGHLTRGRVRCPVGAPFQRTTFRALFEEHTGVDPLDPDLARLGRLLRAAGVRPPGDSGAEDVLDLVLGAVIQPELGHEVPVFVTDWPADRAALARVRPGRDPDGAVTAARFELYAAGVELCNGYHELADAEEQRARIEAENRRRVEHGKEAYPVDERFLAALAHGLPDCAGNALGLDRLVMLVGGLPDLASSRAFPLQAAP